MKTIVPSPFKEDFKILDVGYYTLVTSLSNQDKIKKYLWEEQIKIYETANPNKPYCIIAKQFTDKATYASFKIGLKLPRTGFFVKMNDMVERGIETLILTTIETEYNKKFDITSAEVAGIKKLKEILSDIDAYSNLSEKMLQLNGFAELVSQPGYVYAKNVNNKVNNNLITDYVGIELNHGTEKYNFATLATAEVNKIKADYPNVTFAYIFSAAENGVINNDFFSAKTKFDANNSKIVIWLHWAFDTSDPSKSKLFIKDKDNLTEQEAEDFLNAEWTKQRFNTFQSEKLAYKGSSSSGGDCGLDTEWRAKKCLVDNNEADNTINQNGGANLIVLKYQTGIVLGILDNVLDTLAFLYDSLSVTTITSTFEKYAKRIWNSFTNTTVGGFVLSLTYRVFKHKSLKKGFEEQIQVSFDYFQDLVGSISTIVSLLKSFWDNRAVIIAQIWNSIKTMVGDFLGFNGAVKAGYSAGVVIGEFLIGYFTGVAAAKIAAKVVQGISKIKGGKKLLDIIQKTKDKGRAIADSIEEAFSGSADWTGKLRCKLLNGCFIAGTPVLAAAGTVPIEQLSLGDKVWANTYVNNGYTAKSNKEGNTTYHINADGMRSMASDDNEKCDATAGNFNNWFDIQLKVSKFDGTFTKIRLLRPKWWLDENHIAQKDDATFLELPEMGVSGLATVTDIAQYTQNKNLDSEDSHNDYTQGAVTGLFEHEVNSIHHIALSSNDTLNVTAAHPFYSLTYGTWRMAGELEAGEQLLAKDKSVFVVANNTESGAFKVYNLEVRQWHNFLVGKDAVVVHNDCPKAWREMIDQATKDGNYADLLSIKKYLKPGVKQFLEKNGKVAQAVIDKIQQKFGKISVCFDDFGFPDFRPYVSKFTSNTGQIIEAIIPIDMSETGDRAADFKAANKKLAFALGLPENTKFDKDVDDLGYTWHHHQDGTHMMLVPTGINGGINHAGGTSFAKKDLKGLMPSPFDITNKFLNCK